MAEQEELTLVVNLTDTASAGLVKLRQELAKIAGEAKQVGQEFRGGRGGFGGLGESARRARRDVQDLSAGGGFDRLKRTFDGLRSGSVKPLTEAFSSLGAGFSTAARVGGVFTAALGALGGAAYGANRAMSEFNDQMLRWSQLRNQTGLPIGTLRNMANQMREVGLSTEQAESALSGLSAGMARFRRDRRGMEAEIRAAAGHEKFATLQGGLQELFDTKKPEDFANKLVEIGEKIRASAPTPERGAQAQKQWLQFFGAEALQNFQGQFKAATADQLKMQEELNKLAREYQAITARTQTHWEAISNVMGASLVQKLTPVLEIIERLSKSFKEFMEESFRAGQSPERLRELNKPAVPGGGSVLDYLLRGGAGAIGGTEATPGLGGGGGDDLLENTDETKENTDQLRTLNEFYTRLFADGAGGGRAIRLAALGGGGFGTGAGTGAGAGGGMGGGGPGGTSPPANAPGTAPPGAPSGKLTRADRNNNPGNIKFGPFAQRMGATGADAGGFAVFPDRETGFKAAESLLGTKGYAGKTLAQIGTRWAGGDPNWARNVSAATGIPLDAVLTPEQRSQVARVGIPRAEGSGLGGTGGTGGITEKAPGGRAGGALPNQANRPGHIGGTVTFPGGQTFPWGSGGSRRGSLPYGTHNINIGDIGPVGRRIGSIAGLGGPGGTINDPKFPGAPRQGIQIHAGSGNYLDQLYTQGCFAVARHRWPEFKRLLLEEATRGPLDLSINRNNEAFIHPRGSPPMSVQTFAAQQQQQRPTIATPAQSGPHPYGRKYPTIREMQTPKALRQRQEIEDRLNVDNTNRALLRPGARAAGRTSSIWRPDVPMELHRGIGGDNNYNVDRAALDRAQANSMTHTVNGTGKITVDVNAPRGTKVGAEGGGLFKQTEVNRNIQMAPAASGGAASFDAPAP